MGMTPSMMMAANNSGDPAQVQAMLAQQMAAANPQLTRQARRLYVGNLPVGMGLTEKMLTDFFNATVTGLGIATPLPVLSTWLSSEGTFCFVEFRGVQDASACMSLLQGISLGGRSLRVGRPADYKPPPPHLENFIVGYPPGAPPPPPTTPQAAAALSAVSGLSISALNPLLAPPIPGQPNLGASAAATNLLSNIMPSPPMPSAQIIPTSSSITASGGQGSSANKDQIPTRVLLLLNMVTASELVNDEEYEDIRDDVKEECSKFGVVEEVVIPRPTDSSVGVGSIFVLFREPSMSQSAVSALHGRSFNNNVVEASFYSEAKYKDKIYA